VFETLPSSPPNSRPLAPGSPRFRISTWYPRPKLVERASDGNRTQVRRTAKDESVGVPHAWNRRRLDCCGVVLRVQSAPSTSSKWGSQWRREPCGGFRPVRHCGDSCRSGSSPCRFPRKQDLRVTQGMSEGLHRPGQPGNHLPALLRVLAEQPVRGKEPGRIRRAGHERGAGRFFRISTRSRFSSRGMCGQLGVALPPGTAGDRGRLGPGRHPTTRTLRFNPPSVA